MLAVLMPQPPENIHPQLVEEVRDIDGHPVLADAVAIAVAIAVAVENAILGQLTAIKIHHAHRHGSSGRRQPEPSPTRMRGEQMPPATGHRKATIGDADVMPAVGILGGAALFWAR